MIMKETTLCYIEKNNKYLMLHRTKKANDPNKGKWIGVGGKLKESESKEDFQPFILKLYYAGDKLVNIVE